VDADFRGHQVGLLDWGALYDTPDADLQVSLLTDFVNHLYDVCVPVWWKFVPDLRYPWMTLEMPTASKHLVGFCFRHIELDKQFSAFKSITSNA
jgi:hypothetical protein